MAGFPTGIPGQPPMGGGGPPMTVPGVTQPPSILPPQQVMSAVAKRPESALTLMKQVMVLLEKIAEIDPRQEPRIAAAQKLLRGPAKPGSEQDK